jgi:hypothetical protein
MRPWVEHRQSQGHRLCFLSNRYPRDELKDAIRAVADMGSLRYVLLIGDDDPRARVDPRRRQYTIAADRVPSKVIQRWGGEAEIATDNSYADLDDDQLPDLAVGRWPVRSAEELAVVVSKVLEYERRPTRGEWQRRVNFIAGVGGFGALVDSVIESATKKFLCEGIPATYAISMTYGSWRSPFCPDPRRFRDATLARLNEGCLFWVYIGHGRPSVLDYVRVADRAFPVLDTDDAARFHRAGGPPIAIFLACYAAAFDAPQDCLAEVMLRSEEGPVAVFGGSRVTMPYAMAVLGDALMQEYFTQRRETLGQVILHAKRRSVAPPSPDKEDQFDTRHWLDMLGAALSGPPESLEAERREHLLLFNLLGDPLLRIPRADEVKLAAAETATAGSSLQVAGHTPLSGRLTLELVCRRDRTKTDAPHRANAPLTDRDLEAFAAVYAQANDRRWARVSRQCAAGDFVVQFDVPPDAEGPCYVRAFVDGSAGHALGAAEVRIKSLPATPRMATRSITDAK